MGVSPKLPEKAPTIDEFIETQAKLVDSGRLRELAVLSANIRKKAAEASGRGRPMLSERARLVAVILDSPFSKMAQDPIPQALAEMGVAASYLLAGMDCIPDAVLHLGLDDDDALLERIFIRQGEDLRLYSIRAGVARLDPKIFG